MTPLPKPEEVDLVIYHASCADGFCAAWTAWRKIRDQAEYVYAQYGWDPPDVEGKNVAILDFSYKRSVLEDMLEKANSLVVLDHHKTAKEDLEGLENAVFDETKSGAVLAWEFFWPGEIVPLHVRYIEDRDLWKWELNRSQDYNAGMRLVDFDFESYNKLVMSADGTDKILREGKIIRSYDEKIAKRWAKKAVPVQLLGQDVLMLNYSGHLVSEVGHAMCQREGYQIALLWHYNGAERQIVCSLRSEEVECLPLARRFDGGGHPHACGFKWSGHIEDLVSFQNKSEEESKSEDPIIVRF